MNCFRSTALVLVLLGIAATALASDYRYLSPAEFRSKLETEIPMFVVDIQVEEEFAAHHLPSARPTYAYPVKSAADRAKLDPLLPEIQAGDEPVVIICPRGGGGAKRTFDYLLGAGVDADRLLILEQGQQGWPYPEMVKSR